MERCKDGFYHPASEADLVELVQQANREGRQLRVRGAVHSVSHAIYTDRYDGNRINEQFPQKRTLDLNVKLDRYCSWQVIDEERRLIQADAGVHLGGDPMDPTAPEERSLLYALHRKHWAVAATGGITHQTVSGFTATGSSGGSLQHSFNENLHAFRLIDGCGRIHDIDRDHKWFPAMAPNLGLLGIVSKITFRCDPDYMVSGQESVQPAHTATTVKLFAKGAAGAPPLERYLRETEYARLEWWPQRNFDRLVIWSARRDPAPALRAHSAIGPALPLVPFDRFRGAGTIKQFAVGVLYAVLGNLNDVRNASGKLMDNFVEVQQKADAALDRRFKRRRTVRWAVKGLIAAARWLIRSLVSLLRPTGPVLRWGLPWYFPTLAGFFVPFDGPKGPRQFHDWGYKTLPMDNAVDDVLLPTSFTEAWIPIDQAHKVLPLLDRHFREAPDVHAAYELTGIFAWEIYSSPPSHFWLSPSYTSPHEKDEWRAGVLRINPYWCAEAAGNPTRKLFREFWELLRKEGVPFRLHWGKYQPENAAEWVGFFKDQYPCWDDFMKLREELDPNGIFLTQYWRDRLGLGGVQRIQRTEAPCAHAGVR